VPTVVFHPEALAEFRDARDFYESRRQGLGLELRLEAEHTVAWIERNPNVCAVDQLGVRATKVGRFPFAIYFTSTGDEVNIIAFAHQSREPYYWRDRIDE
jgi:toxin ParE1/3/4